MIEFGIFGVSKPFACVYCGAQISLNSIWWHNTVDCISPEARSAIDKKMALAADEYINENHIKRFKET